jgi:hypothetical protein
MNRFFKSLNTTIIRGNTLSNKTPIRSSLRLAQEYEATMNPTGNVSSSVPYPTPFFLTAGGRHTTQGIKSNIYEHKKRHFTEVPPREGVPVWGPRIYYN